MQHARSHGPLRVSSDKLEYFLKGIPLFLMLVWVTKAYTPDLRAKSALSVCSGLSAPEKY